MAFDLRELLHENWCGRGSCPGSGGSESLPGPPSSFPECPVSPQRFCTQPGWRGLLWGSPWDCSRGSRRGLQPPQLTPSLPQRPWGSLSPGRPWETSLWKGPPACPVLARLPAAGSGPGRPGAAAAGERRPVYESWSGKQLEAQGWRRRSEGGRQSSHWPSRPWSARLAAGLLCCGENADS